MIMKRAYRWRGWCDRLAYGQVGRITRHAIHGSGSYIIRYTSSTYNSSRVVELLIDDSYCYKDTPYYPYYTIGMLESMFGYLRLGKVASVVTEPVICGFLNAFALFLIKSQVCVCVCMHAYGM